MYYRDNMDQDRVVQPLFNDGGMATCRVYYGIVSVGIAKLPISLLHMDRSYGFSETDRLDPEAKPRAGKKPRRRVRSIWPWIERKED